MRRKSNLKKAMEKGLARKYEDNKLRKRKKILERFLKTEKGQEVLKQIESGALPAESLDVDGKNIEIKATVVPEEADAAVAEVVEEEPEVVVEEEPEPEESDDGVILEVPSDKMRVYLKEEVNLDEANAPLLKAIEEKDDKAIFQMLDSEKEEEVVEDEPEVEEKEDE